MLSCQYVTQNSSVCLHCLKDILQTPSQSNIICSLAIFSISLVFQEYYEVPFLKNNFIVKKQLYGWKLYTIKSTHLFKVYNSVLFLMFTELCTTRQSHVRDTGPPQHPCSFLLSPLICQLLICFLPLDLPVLDSSYTWNHTICGLL